MQYNNVQLTMKQEDRRKSTPDTRSNNKINMTWFPWWQTKRVLLCCPRIVHPPEGSAVVQGPHGAASKWAPGADLSVQQEPTEPPRHLPRWPSPPGPNPTPGSAQGDILPAV